MEKSLELKVEGQLLDVVVLVAMVVVRIHQSLEAVGMAEVVAGKAGNWVVVLAEVVAGKAGNWVVAMAKVVVLAVAVAVAVAGN